MNRSILVVDEDLQALQTLQGLVQSMRPEWKMTFAQGGAEALEEVRKQPFHAVISSLTLPGSEPGQVFREIRELQPTALRIALTGPGETDAVIRSLTLVQQALGRTRDAGELIAMVESTERLGSVDGELGNVLGRIGSLPTLPRLYRDLMRALEDDQTTPRRVGEILRQDIGMTARLLQLVNSPFFGLRRSVEDIHEAVHFLGLETIQALVLAEGVFEQIGELATRRISLADIWKHSLDVARGARAIAAMEGLSRHVRAEAFLGGVLHDLGIVILAREFPERYDQVIEHSHTFGMPIVIAERSEFGASHQEVGAYLLGLWGIQSSVVTAVSCHHSPGRFSVLGLTSVMTIHLADVLCSHGQHFLFEHLTMDEVAINSLDLRDRIPGWRQLLAQPGW